jgi:hypothetical protein
MTAKVLVEQILREIYGGHPPNDAAITKNLVHVYVNQGWALAAKANMKDNLQIEGLGFVNNSFYATFTDLSVTQEGNFTYKVALPSFPLGIGTSGGLSTLRFVDSDGNVSQPCIPLSEAQASFFDSMRILPGKLLFIPRGKNLYVKSTLPLYNYTAEVVMVSSGDTTDITREINVPDDYVPAIIAYATERLLRHRSAPQDNANDGIDKA